MSDEGSEFPVVPLCTEGTEQKAAFLPGLYQALVQNVPG